MQTAGVFTVRAAVKTPAPCLFVEVTSMDLTPIYDIFRRLPNGELVWTCAARGLEEVRARLVNLKLTAPSDCVIYVRRG